MSGPVLAALADLVEARSGLRFVEGRCAELATKAAEAYARSGCESWQAFIERLANPLDEDALHDLLDRLTVGETYFFRHRSYFEALEREVLPRLIAARRQSRQLRVWCAGCASGEEAYSLAILVRRLLPDFERWHVDILATDLNRTFLARAERGVYSEWSFRETDAGFKAAYFVSDGRRYHLRAQYRGLVRFQHLNLAGADYPSTASGTTALDLILCRNVLIYFAAERARDVVARLRDALVPGGWLVLGPSDPLPGLTRGFELRTLGDAILYQRSDRDHTTAPTTTTPAALLPTWPSATVASGEQAPPPTPGPSTLVETVAPRASAAPPCPQPTWQEALVAAQACADAGRLEEAEAHCQRGIALAGMQPEPYYVLGAVRQAGGDDQAALAAFRQALYVDRTFVPALLAQASLHRRHGAPHRASRMLARARDLLQLRPSQQPVLPATPLAASPPWH